MRTGGANEMSGDAVDEEIDFLAADISISMERESCTAAFSVLKEDLDRGLEIFSDILIHPEFQEEKLILARELKIEELKRIRDDPQKLAFREFTRAFFKGDTRGRLATVESVDRISRADLIEYHRRYFVPSNLMMAVAGDFSKEEMLKKIEKCFGTWHSERTVEKLSPPEGDRAGGLYYFYKDTPQSVLISGQIAPGQQNRDYYAMEVLDFIAGGGGFKSRIFSEVRNNLGLAYSAGSIYSPKSDYGIFGTYAMTNANSSAKVLSVIQNILEEFKTAAVEDSVLKWAKDSLTNRFVFSFTSAAQIARQQMMIEFNGLDEDFLEIYCQKIRAVTSDDLRRTAINYLKDTSRVLFVLGDEDRFDNPLADFGNVQRVEIHDDVCKKKQKESSN
ncbi:MAG: pitrilysin family protein [Syntrophales bacterium]|jgi:predicted Zn-dependent peptidase|nr:pitrilysin family protein [Syntrophales bacterium]